MAMQSTQHLLLLLLAMLLAVETAAQPLPNCTRKCGSLEIPYPFGTTEGCYLDTPFLITCNQTSGSPPTPFLQGGKTTVLNISLDGELRISLQSAKDCYNDSGEPTISETSGLKLSHFHISSTRNKLTAIGCDTLGLITGHGSQKDYNTGCESFCNSLVEIVANGTCTGTGCCEASIPEGLSTVVFESSSSQKRHTTVHDFNTCGYAFLVEEGAYNFVSTDIVNLQRTMFPVVVDWSVGKQTCEEAKKNLSSYACVAENSYCSNSKNGPGYRCHCSDGFQGNPYLLDGCEEINKCLESNNCIDGAICHNFRGGYYCSCPKGHKGDGKIDGTGCLLKSSTNSRSFISLIIALGVVIIIVICVYWWMKNRKLFKRKEKIFAQNGGILLQQLLAKHGGSSETARVFSEEELKEATNNFDERRVLGQGYYGKVYKGELLDNRMVAIKRSKINNPIQIEQFINEVYVLSQINHRNVVKLLGCCLQTELPSLVYEFIPNGTISQHLHDQTQSFIRLSWETRLRIATETAGALAYLHSAASTPIIHRDVKTSNILLDSDLTAKVSDFGASRFIPLDQTELTTFVQGTLGYVDPEYVNTGKLTVKSDVYSFGVVLAELVTGKKALSFSRPESDTNLAMYFVSSMNDGRLLAIVDNKIKNEANILELEQVLEVANITKRCLSEKGKKRPTMKEVAMELEGLRILMIKNRQESVEMSSDETGHFLNDDLFPHNVDIEAGVGSSGVNYGMYSLNQVSMILSGGR
ncbi:wall-associated receptor kinase 1-like [Gastrolobium bilobum]|uniref:wall-associated receptor kinase 1-like n=1 Tax=Gastrolobium bilobum TaxID=150636 RepID=UPI002AB0CABA|nr:wall-associated receptor kinase 1-like [Gastrolobium bilobum]